jgi:hypothetical protein
MCISTIFKWPNGDLIGGLNDILEQLSISLQAFNAIDTFA